MVKIPEKINKIIYDYLNDVSSKIKIDKVYLFGSYAKGIHDKDSDLDIAIFSEDFKGQRFVDSVAFLLSLARKYREICIEPVAFTISDFLEGNPFVKEIYATGKEIELQKIA
jgi:predicted nucleotidyltransferase